MDISNFDIGGSCHKYAEVITYAKAVTYAIPKRNQTARTTARALLDNFFFHYGFPVKLHSGQGAIFSPEFMQTNWHKEGQGDAVPSDGQWHDRAV